MKLRHRLLLPLLALMGAAAPALAQDNWPSRPIEFLGGFPNGSGVDIYARKLAAPLSQALGVPVVVNNRVGAGGNIASAYVAKARPDGYLILFGTAGTHAINATLYRNLPFNPMRDVTHIAHLGDVPNVLITSIQHRPQYTACQAVLADARARPGALNYASTGNGASTHLAGARFAVASNIEMVHVPFTGQGGAVTSLLGGQTDLFFNQVGPALGLVQQGAVRALGVTTPQRLSVLPDVPTIAEACNLPGFESTTWYGVFGPPGMPAAIQQRLNAEIRKIIEAPEFRDWLVNSQGIAPSTVRTTEEFRQVHEQDIARWGEVVRAARASVD
ncbi:Bug family tripartite tricarboxylate transporter substrate binding protein [Falsiroseomonas selenitidurans]|uniref:Tripartite tricarboxylate transporter substrate binding protein n=1 Tax=Falsiroseomonas selenitidurans TaxID=2716335 RepID=A0ABX1E962_9PROT|nr:tripartite tricarboxylate transporter substrate binding protein [Falsiroseomonas selenitidurans]NKC33315.1 tripartite tricarboxylate transporter substrate binding protein [Falsiroseomonas selenitidurans]